MNNDAVKKAAVADVAVAALTDDGHVGKFCELTGPHALTLVETTEEMAKASGRQVRFVEASADQFIPMPAEVMGLLTDLFTKVLDARNSRLTNGVQRGLGREPRGFADYARNAAATGMREVSR